MTLGVHSKTGKGARAVYRFDTDEFHVRMAKDHATGEWVTYTLDSNGKLAARKSFADKEEASKFFNLLTKTVG